MTSRIRRQLHCTTTPAVISELPERVDSPIPVTAARSCPPGVRVIPTTLLHCARKHRQYQACAKSTERSATHRCILVVSAELAHAAHDYDISAQNFPDLRCCTAVRSPAPRPMRCVRSASTCRPALTSGREDLKCPCQHPGCFQKLALLMSVPWHSQILTTATRFFCCAKPAGARNPSKELRGAGLLAAGSAKKNEAQKRIVYAHLVESSWEPHGRAAGDQMPFGSARLERVSHGST